MIALTREALEIMEREAVAAYPLECCGLLVGTDDAFLRAEPSRNMVEGRDRFEVDPALRFRLMRALEGGPHRIVGHYHSHPDGLARPSETDLSMAWEPDLLWVIVPVSRGRAGAAACFRVDADGRGFSPVPMALA